MRTSIPILLLLLSPWGAAPAAPRHDGLDEQIAAVSEELRLSPRDERLLILRSDLYRRHAQWDEAFADQALVRDGRASQAFVLARAHLFRDLGHLPACQVVLDAHLGRSPGDARARLLRAEVLEQRGRLAASLADLDRALAELEAPQPDHFVLRARVAAACDDLEEPAVVRALAGLDQGIALLGPLPSLQLTAIDLELGRREYDRALARLGTLRVSSDRQETWLALRGDLLGAAGRPLEAREAYRASLAAIRGLRSKQRQSPGVQALERAILTKLGEWTPPAAEQPPSVSPAQRRPQ